MFRGTPSERSTWFAMGSVGKSPTASESGGLYEAPVSGRMAGFRWCVGASVQTKQLGALAFVGKCLAFGGRVVTSFVQSLEAGDFVIGQIGRASCRGKVKTSEARDK